MIQQMLLEIVCRQLTKFVSLFFQGFLWRKALIKCWKFFFFWLHFSTVIYFFNKIYDFFAYTLIWLLNKFQRLINFLFNFFFSLSIFPFVFFLPFPLGLSQWSTICVLIFFHLRFFVPSNVLKNIFIASRGPDWNM